MNEDANANANVNVMVHSSIPATSRRIDDDQLSHSEGDNDAVTRRLSSQDQKSRQWSVVYNVWFDGFCSENV